MVRRQQLISLLEDHFFPKWRAVLQHWLMHNPDYEEVTAWYLGWKVSCLSSSSHTQIRALSGACLVALPLLQAILSLYHYCQHHHRKSPATALYLP